MRNKSATRTALRELLRLRVLPPQVARFQWRARRRATVLGDAFALEASTRPADLARLLKLARGRRSVVELGTANGWTAIALALDDAKRTVVTFDPFDRPERAAYLELVPDTVKRRIEFVAQPGQLGPGATRTKAVRRHVELLYIDSSHDRDETIAEVTAWRQALGVDALIVFDDYGHPDYPGVRDAVDTLGLVGETVGTLHVVSVAAASQRTGAA